MYKPSIQAELLQRLNDNEPNNHMQQVIFDEIMEKVYSIHSNQTPAQLFYFIQGPGGAGKTSLFNKLQAACRAHGQLIGICAATTLAALLFDGGFTAHSLFKYPVVEESDIDMEFLPECNLENTQRLQLLLQTNVFFWDEFISNDRNLFEAVIRSFLQFTKQRFIFICGGDFGQILPADPKKKF